MNDLAFQRNPRDGLRELALFAGAGGGILAGELLGWRVVCAVECDAYAAGVLVARQLDGLLPPFPVWDDVRTFDAGRWRGVVDVVSGGFPCQDISVAGKGAGIDGERSGLWCHMARIVGEVRPRYVFVENSPALVTRGLVRVLSDLTALGYDCRWTVLGAANVGAPHQRDRLWLVAHAHGIAGHPWRPSDSTKEPRGWHLDRSGVGAHPVAHADSLRQSQPKGRKRKERRWLGDCGDEQPALRDPYGARLAQRQGVQGHPREELAALERADWWELEPAVGRVVDGLAHRVDRLRCLGNGQVPQCAAGAWRLLNAEPWLM